MKMSQMRKRPKLKKQIFDRYIEFYLNNPPSDLDDYELMYFESQYSGIMKNLTRDFTEEQFVNFYQNLLRWNSLNASWVGLLVF